MASSPQDQPREPAAESPTGLVETPSTVARAPDSGASVLDLASLIGGAAIAAVHLRAATARPEDSIPPFLFWLAFVGIAITSSGPLVLLTRRLKYKSAARIAWSEVAWLVLGLPWLLVALARSVVPAQTVASLYSAATLIAVSLACAITLILVWVNWVRTRPGSRAGEANPRWTARVGVALAVTWPLQYGFAMIVATP